jgi:hypothetical protein
MSDYTNPEVGKTYVSPSLDTFSGDGRKVRIATKGFESESTYAFGRIGDEVVIRQVKGGAKKVVAKFVEDSRGISVLSIQGYTVATDKPHNASFSFIGEEIETLLNFVRRIQTMDISHRGGNVLNDIEAESPDISNQQVSTFLIENQEFLSEVLRSEVTSEDLVAIAYRKKQLVVRTI